MDLDLRVPFARQNSDGAVVGVEDVSRGRAADCACLSCRRPLIARQGEVNAWHFAHDFSIGDTELCEFSQCESIRTAIAWLLPQLRSILVPGLNDRPAKQVSCTTITSAPDFDACIKIDDFSLYLWFGYSQRPWPGQEDTLHDKNGLLILSIDNLVDREANKITSIDQLRRWMTEEESAKHWHHHPLLRRENSSSELNYEHHCVICDRRWLGGPLQESATCRECGTHLNVSSTLSDINGNS